MRSIMPATNPVAVIPAIKILVGLSRATSGQATVCGVDCGKDARKIKRLVGYMPDVFGAYDNMRVREYLDFFGAAFKIPRNQRQSRIDKCLELTGSTYMKDRYVEALSHGMKQRVGIARTMLHDWSWVEVPITYRDPSKRLGKSSLTEALSILWRLRRRFCHGGAHVPGRGARGGAALDNRRRGTQAAYGDVLRSGGLDGTLGTPRS